MPVDEETLPITLRFGSKLTSDLIYGASFSGILAFRMGSYC